MDDLEDDCGCDDHTGKTYVKSKREQRWLVLSAVLELFADVFMAFHKLFSTFEDSTLQRFEYRNDRLKFMEQAAREIETLTSGDSNATTNTTGTG